MNPLERAEPTNRDLSCNHMTCHLKFRLPRLKYTWYWMCRFINAGFGLASL